MWEPGTQALGLLDERIAAAGHPVAAIMNTHACTNTVQHVRLTFMCHQTTLTQRKSLIHCGTQDYTLDTVEILCGGQQIVTIA